MAQSKQTVGFPLVRDTFGSGDMWGQALRLTSEVLYPAPSIHHVLPAFAYVPVCSEAKRALLSLRPSTQGCTVSTFLLLGLSERPL